MTNFYSKYLKYKKKYLMAKSNMRGGGEEQVDLGDLLIGTRGVEDAEEALNKLGIKNRKIEVRSKPAKLIVEKKPGDDLVDFQETLDEFKGFKTWDAYIDDRDLNKEKVIINFETHNREPKKKNERVYQ